MADAQSLADYCAILRGFVNVERCPSRDGLRARHPYKSTLAAAHHGRRPDNGICNYHAPASTPSQSRTPQPTQAPWQGSTGLGLPHTPRISD